MAAFTASSALPPSQTPVQQVAATEALAPRANPALMVVATRKLEAMHAHVQSLSPDLRVAVLDQVVSTNDLAIAKQFLSESALDCKKELAKVTSLRKESYDGGYYFEKVFGKNNAEALVKLIWDYGVWPTDMTTPVIDQIYVQESHAIEAYDNDAESMTIRCKGTCLPHAISDFKQLQTLVIISDTLTCLPRALRDLSLDTLNVSECPNLKVPPVNATKVLFPMGSIQKVS